MRLTAQPAPKDAKNLGAFYTPPAMARALVDWAIREPTDLVCDPSFGGLVFLASARDRLKELGAAEHAISDQLAGIELDEVAFRAALEQSAVSISRDRLRNASFFDISPEPGLSEFDALIGNPPYIRYQGFNGSANQAHKRSLAAGVKLTRLASSWAPFIVHSVSFIRTGGRMAQVLPAEFLHAQYAKPVRSFLMSQFGGIKLVAFEERVFPGAEEEVVLLLADGKGESTPTSRIEFISCKTVEDLGDLASRKSLRGSTISGTKGGADKLLFQLLPTETQDLFSRVVNHAAVRPLGDVATVDIGAVTGDNKFFLLTGEAAQALDPSLLRLTVSKARHIKGAKLTEVDLAEFELAGDRMRMFVADDRTPSRTLETARAYLARGVRQEVHKRYKTRIRDDWWSVPLPNAGAAPDLFLTYCSNSHPRLVHNAARALNTNTVHGVTLLKDGRRAQDLAALFINSVTLLSAELIGRSYGGGVLKLEPTEAERVVLPPFVGGIGRKLDAIDRHVREGQLDRALAIIDPIALGDGLGLSADEIEGIRAAALQLRERRRSRGSAPRA